VSGSKVRNMTAFKKRITSLVLAACLFCAMSHSVFAAEVNESGGSGITPVNLTTTNGGLNEDGNFTDVTPTKLNVTLPTALPLAMSDDGTVVTADNCRIVNHSYGAVRVKSVTISAASDWNLTAFGDKATLAGEKVDSNKLGFALSIGGGKQVMTKTNAATQRLITAPLEGCYMTGVGDPAGNTALVRYAAIVTPVSSAVNNSTIANVIFVIEWDSVG